MPRCASALPSATPSSLVCFCYRLFIDRSCYRWSWSRWSWHYGLASRFGLLAACSVRADSTRDCKSVCAAASVGTANVNATSTISDPAVCSSLNTVTTCLNGCDAELASVDLTLFYIVLIDIYFVFVVLWYRWRLLVCPQELDHLLPVR